MENKKKYKIRVFKLTFITVLFFLSACNSESANDCFQSAGKMVKEERSVQPFTKILVNEGISMVIKQGETYKVEVESGKNLLNDITAEVIDGQLILTNENVCNYVRDYELTTFYVTAPEIEEIRSATQREIRSDGVLNLESLMVYSENWSENEYLTSGDLYLNLNVNSFRMVFNGLSNIHLTGSASSLNINMASGNGRFEGENFMVENAQVYHRGSNDLILNVQNSLKGNIYSTGDIVLVSRPETVEVEEHYQGRLVYRD
ncbi:DUF2807 domain-containing protein [Galbibacter sp. EGI 63066]|uniref:head GIN domain-containing protein n=1 Tax=Galbibacter sp. EGI 63066 TaxID=2993559 RepID=UPI002249607A|nr:head GIN domain-containing protein [Galbibacter sp. EGI 63066]MCX2679479.1 DUF2807 domain-containing protein [Galbibacter sp. EGI 63066]